MVISSDEPFVLPDEVTPRRFGLLNILFASLLISGNLSTMLFVMMVPATVKIVDHVGAVVRLRVEHGLKTELAEWRAKEAEAQTPEEKDLARSHVDDLERRPQEISAVTAMGGVRAYQDRRVMTYVNVELISGLTLNALMIVAGIGLLRLREWARKLAIIVAAIKLARLFLLSGIMIAVINPITMEYVNKDMAPLLVKMQAGPKNGAGIFVSPQWFAAQGAAMIVVNVIFAMVYPTLVLIQMRKVRVKAACNPSGKTKSSELPW